MGCYYTLCHNTYSYSILFYKVYIRRENAGSWNSGLEKEQILETYSAQLQKSWNSTGVIFRIYKKYWAKEAPEGGHTLSTRVGAHPTPWACPCLVGPLAGLRCPSSAIWGLLPWKKSEATLRDEARCHEAEPWRNQSRAPAELFCRGYFPPGGGNHHHRHHQCSSHREGVNLHQHLHQHHLISNPSSSLVSNLCPKTSHWYLWVASSVDYSL